ncbi:unnamed protein product [Lymnaea stagnalis]|uniref:28S ribosomal protein S28, mitochondrial n=1 Tax=Lymnaea stagnalis TaxID=6523 RepID=A0AAV2HT44_LYMST
MALSLVRRVSILQKSILLKNTLKRAQNRLFSSENKGNGPNDPQDEAQNIAEEIKSNDLNNYSSPSLNHAQEKRTSTELALDKFAKLVEKVKVSQVETVSNFDRKLEEDSQETFPSMLRKSKLVSLGDHQGRLIEGNVFEVMGDDLYIDFGGKFHCVCPRPKINPLQYRRGTKVLLNLQCLEMSSAFLGSDIHVTLLEADAILLGLSPSERKGRSSKTAQKL